MALLDRLKPTEAEVRELALREMTPAGYVRTRALACGPFLTVLALAMVGLLSVPSIILRLLFRPRLKA